MINAKIINSYLGAADLNGSTTLGLQFAAANKENEFRSRPIVIRDAENIQAFLRVVGVPCWEEIGGKAVQIEVNDNNEIVKIANIIDEDLSLNFSDEAPAENTSEQEVLQGELVEEQA